MMSWQPSVLFILVLCLIIWYGNTQYLLTDEGEVLVPLSSKENDASTRNIHFSFHVYESHLEHKIVNYCEVQNIRYHFCHKLYSHIVKLQQLAQQEYVQKKLELPQHSQYYPSSFATLGNLHPIENMDYIRHLKALSDQLYLQSLQQGLHVETRLQEIEDMQTREMITFNFLKQYLQTNYPNHDILRIAMIHSVAYSTDENTSVRELRVILQAMKEARLLEESQTQLILVLHYGYPYPSSIHHEYPDALFFHVSSITSFDEIPSIRMLISLAKYFQQTQSHDNFVHMLYLTTFTTIYQHVYITLEQYRQMMMYYLLEQQESCYYLLESTEFDMITAGNYRSNPKRSLDVNYFWTTSSYIAIFPLIDWNHRDVTAIGKEYFFQSSMMKVFTPHVSKVNHWHDLYPRYCYAPVKPNAEIPTFAMFVQDCQNPLKEDYVRLHNVSALLDINEYPPYSEGFHRAESRREVSSFCTALELSRVYD